MASGIELIKEDFAAAEKVLADFRTSEKAWEQVEKVAQLLVATLQNGNKIFACGNGGSHCDAMHFAEELSGRYRKDRPALAALAISDPSHISCVSNDMGYDAIFARYLEAIGKPGDAVVMFTSSGNSKSLLEAAHAARKMGIKVIGLTGKDGGALAPLCDAEIRVEIQGYADRIQEIHIKLVHSLIHYIEVELGYIS